MSQQQQAANCPGRGRDNCIVLQGEMESTENTQSCGTVLFGATTTPIGQPPAPGALEREIFPKSFKVVSIPRDSVTRLPARNLSFLPRMHGWSSSIGTDFSPVVHFFFS